MVSDPLHPNQGELGEVDACENSIDGMGAINFTDEEDCGFFGMPHAVNHVMEYILTGLQAHHRISPLCVIFRVQLHETMLPVADMVAKAHVEHHVAEVEAVEIEPEGVDNAVPFV